MLGGMGRYTWPGCALLEVERSWKVVRGWFDSASTQFNHFRRTRPVCRPALVSADARLRVAGRALIELRRPADYDFGCDRLRRSRFRSRPSLALERTLWVEAVKQAPNRLRPRILLARASDVETASGILDAAEAMAPNDPRPAIEKGLRFMAVNRPDSALVEFDHALALAPDDPMALNNHGAALFQTWAGRRRDRGFSSRSAH